MSKIIDLILQTVSYFLIVLFLFWIMIKAGINTESSMFTLAIGSTIGWIIIKAGSSIIKKYRKK